MEARERALHGVRNWLAFLKHSHLLKGKAKLEVREQLKKILMGLEDKPTILISGEFNAGKTTFINALLGEKVLVSDVTPATAMITKLTYGHEKRLFLHFKDQTIQECDFSFLKEVTAEGDKHGDNIRSKLAFIEIQLPFELLKFYTLIDSPGLTSLFQKHSDVTNHFFEEADTAIWLFNSLNVGTASEVTWLQKLYESGIPTIGLINGIDRLDEDEDLDAFYEYNVRRLTPMITQLDGISSKDILEGKLKDDEQLKEWGNLEAVESLFVSFENEKLELVFLQVQTALNDFYKSLLREKESSVFLKNRELLLTHFLKMEKITLDLAEELKAEYQKKEDLIAEWNLFLQNNLLEPTNIEPFITKFKKPIKLRGEWESIVLPQLNAYIKWFEEVNLEDRVLNVKKVAAEECFQDINKVYFKFFQTYKYIKADREYRIYAENVKRKIKILNSKQEEVEKSLKTFTKVVEQEVKKEIEPVNERIKRLNMDWRNVLLPIKQVVGKWAVEDLVKMEDYAEEIRDFQREVLPYLYLAVQKHAANLSKGDIQHMLGLLSTLYKERDETSVLARIIQMGSLKNPIAEFKVRAVTSNHRPYMQSSEFMPVPLDLKQELVKLSPQLIKDPGVIAASVAVVMSIF
ncbi:dynamin family protein [Planococcus lenghuensis]|uniref:Dynamin N-terminal domain-containing protein n=1 Tax=Planococcus lenghuensis TaxID=2213202 RepID=A0A1Q2L132_9BACL|nr:dynamin family protein [Planococcus lenghuensis]AQQ54175.1 hypothetical protein B0X71_14385 [Planococcus lenghuensis]